MVKFSYRARCCLQGIRERILCTDRSYQVARDNKLQFADICVRWLVGTCSVLRKVNLRPIWSPAPEAISSLAKRFGDVVWDIILSKLQQPQGAHQIPSPDWMTTTEESAKTDVIISF